MTVLFDTGTGKHRKLINMTEVGEAYTPEYRATLLALHAFCGYDTSSTFKGRGHILPIKTLEKLPRFTRPLARLGNAWEIGDLLREVEEYTCAINGNSRIEGQVLPQRLADILLDTIDADSDEEGEEEDSDVEVVDIVD